MSRALLLACCLVGFFVGLGSRSYTQAQRERPWIAKTIYLKDERTKICFAYQDGGMDYGPYFTYVPCELVDKANWHFYGD